MECLEKVKAKQMLPMYAENNVRVTREKKTNLGSDVFFGVLLSLSLPPLFHIRYI